MLHWRGSLKTLGSGMPRTGDVKRIMEEPIAFFSATAAVEGRTRVVVQANVSFALGGAPRPQACRFITPYPTSVAYSWRG